MKHGGNVMKRISTLLAMVAWGLLGPAAPARGADCNANGIDDRDEIAAGTSRDCNANAVPDECDLAPGTLTFEAYGTLASGGNNSNAILRDLDGDGDVDMLTDLEELEVHLNRGDGTFYDPDVYVVGGDNRPWDVAAADLDGDGDTDFLATCYETTEVPVLLNRGDGTFDLSVSRDLTTGSRHPVPVDLDGDGDVDFVSMDWRVETVSVLRNRGDGSFDSAERFPAIPGTSLAAADLNGDGAPDLALVGARHGGENGREAAVLLNDGTGRFASPTIVTVGERPEDLVAGDLDGDGVADIAAVCYASEDVWILRGRGDGTFEEPVVLPAVRTASLIKAADVDLDGDLDLVAAGGRRRHEPAGIAIFTNAGDGTFSAPEIHEFTGQFNVLELLDLDLDGLPEIVGALYFVGEMVVLRNLGEGRFETAGVFGQGVGGTVQVEGEDIDGDGDVDLVSAHLNIKNSVTLLTNATGQGFEVGCDPFLRGDVNADGAVSISDLIMLRRYMFGPGIHLTCADAADLSDDEAIDICDAITLLQRVFFHPDWSEVLPEPFPEPGLDPTMDPSEITPHYCGSSDRSSTSRLACSEYRVEPSVETDDLILIGDVDAVSGAEVRVPVYLSTSVPADAIQVILQYDPEMIEILPDGLDFEGTCWEEALPDGALVPEVAILTPHPELGVAVAAIAGSLTRDGYEAGPGEDLLVAWVRVRVAEGVPDDAELPMALIGATEEGGVGPYALRSEISFDGDARLLSALPRLEGAILRIVPDQAFFRGDTNGDERLDLSDAVSTLETLFTGGRPFVCADAADANDDGKVDISDPITTLGHLFLGGPDLPPPFPEKGLDPTPDTLGCLAPGSGR